MHWQLSQSPAQGGRIGLELAAETAQPTSSQPKDSRVGGCAQGHCGSGTVRLDPAHPQGAAQLALSGFEACSWRVAAVRPEPKHAGVPEEIYVRQQDLICRYRQSPEDSFAYQLNWRLLEPQGPFDLAVELWLSVQTDLLDTYPSLLVSCAQLGSAAWSIFGHRQLWDAGDAGELSSDLADIANSAERGPAALMTRSEATAGPLSGLWLIETSDQLHARLEATAPAMLGQSASHVASSPASSQQGDELGVRLFDQFMEKGVIRRGRMRFLLAAQPLSASDIAIAYREFADSPLPLTA